MRHHRSYCKYLLPAFAAILWLPAATSARVVIDEILADPPSGSAGDANGDGIRQTYADEFIELYNTGPDTVSLGGWRIGDDDVVSLFTFPDSSKLLPGNRLLLFGGGSPTGFTVPTFIDDGRIGNGLTNSGDVILLLDAAGDTVDKITLATWPKDQSITRAPTGNGPFIAHKTAASDGTAFSPGYASPDSTAQSNPPAASPTDSSQTATPPSDAHSDAPAHRNTNYPIVISEILADPPSGIAGDANGDGRRNTYEDEFIELYNAGPSAISLAGWRLTDDDVKASSAFYFPADAVLFPDSHIVLFGGGQPTGFAVPVFVDDGRIGNGLTNSGDRLLLLDAHADTVVDYTFASKSNLNQSLARRGETYRPHNHLPGRGLFSPGQIQTQYTAFSISDPGLTEGQTLDLVLIGDYATGSDTLDASDFQWLSVDPHIAEIRTRARVKALRPGRTRIECWLDDLFLAQRHIRIAALEPHNDPPRIISTPDTTAFAGGWYRYSVRANDPESNTLVFTFATAPDWLDLDYQSGLIQGRAPDTTGAFPIAFEAADGRGGLAAQRFTLHLRPRPQIHIDEVLSDPPPGPLGDANQDGRRYTYGDEFVELHNAGQIPVNLGGCRLSDSSGKTFIFPPQTVVPPDGRAVVFGDGTADRPLFFSAGGRIGDGLGNRRDKLYLVGPQGLDTLARFAYDLSRDPDQSIVDRGRTLHTAWPGRSPFSPGTARPLLQSLRPLQRKLNLVQGEKRTLRLLGLYSDGNEYPIDSTAIWTASDTGLAAVADNHILTAIDTGSCLLFVRLDSFAIYPDTIAVQIRQALSPSLRFAPTWRDSLLPTSPQTFIVRSDQPEKQTYIWSLNGRRLPIMAPQYLHTPGDRPADTIRVEIRRGFEKTTRQWILHAPPATAKRTTDIYAPRLQIWPNPFNANTHIRYLQTATGTTQLSLYNLQGQRIRTLVDAILPAGLHQFTWDGLDQRGHPAASGLYLTRLTTPTTQIHSKILLLR